MKNNIDHTTFIKNIIHNFFIREKWSPIEQNYMQELFPMDLSKELSIEDHIEIFNEGASFYTGELARLIRQYLLHNSLLAKDDARIVKEELILFR